MINTKMGAFLLVGFIAGAFIASPELRAYAANTVFSTDIKDGEVKTPDLANNAVTSAKIKDGEVKTDDIAPSAIGSLRIKDNDVKAQDIATDAVGADEIAKDTVGASELAGVDKLIFAGCNYAVSSPLAPGFFVTVNCPVAGTDPEDEVVASDTTQDCFAIVLVVPRPDAVRVSFQNVCAVTSTFSSGHVSIIVYDELPDKVPL